MTNREFGRAYIEDARVILAEAEASLQQGHFHRAVRKCQEWGFGTVRRVLK